MNPVTKKSNYYFWGLKTPCHFKRQILGSATERRLVNYFVNSTCVVFEGVFAWQDVSVCILCPAQDTHSVSFILQNTSFQLGCALSGPAVLCLSCWVIRHRRWGLLCKIPEHKEESKIRHLLMCYHCSTSLLNNPQWKQDLLVIIIPCRDFIQNETFKSQQAIHPLTSSSLVLSLIKPREHMHLAQCIVCNSGRCRHITAPDKPTVWVDMRYSRTILRNVWLVWV